jgi:hypothetical protein
MAEIRPVNEYTGVATLSHAFYVVDMGEPEGIALPSMTSDIRITATESNGCPHHHRRIKRVGSGQDQLPRLRAGARTASRRVEAYRDLHLHRDRSPGEFHDRNRPRRHVPGSTARGTVPQARPRTALPLDRTPAHRIARNRGARSPVLAGIERHPRLDTHRTSAPPRQHCSFRSSSQKGAVPVLRTSPGSRTRPPRVPSSFGRGQARPAWCS